MLDRTGIAKLSAVYTQKRMAREFGISVPTLRQYLRGREPQHVAIANEINMRVGQLLNKKGLPIVALERYCNDHANFRLSMDEREKGPDSPYKVLRYPIGSCTQAYLQAANVLYLRKKDADKIMGKRYHDHNMITQLTEMGIITGQVRVNLTDGSGLPKRLSECYVIDLGDSRLGDLCWLLEASAKREDPAQEGRVLDPDRTP